MLKARLKLYKYDFDIKAAEAATKAALSGLLEESAKAFLKATFDHIPVWSGMARASTLPMARYLNLSLQVSKRSDAPDRINLGQSQGAFEFEYGPKVYRMTFISNVFHYYLMDNYSLPQNYGQPWNSLSYGVNAFIDKFESDGEDILPPMILFTRKTPLKIG